MTQTTQQALLKIIEEAEYALQELRTAPAGKPRKPRKPRGPLLKSAGATSMYKGVCWDYHAQSWKVRITSDGAQINLGRYGDEIEAARKYDAAARRLKGPDAVLNFPEPSEQPEPAVPQENAKPRRRVTQKDKALAAPRKRLGFTGT